jgi:hypothetical protein
MHAVVVAEPKVAGVAGHLPERGVAEAARHGAKHNPGPSATERGPRAVRNAPEHRIGDSVKDLRCQQNGGGGVGRHGGHFEQKRVQKEALHNGHNRQAKLARGKQRFGAHAHGAAGGAAAVALCLWRLTQQTDKRGVSQSERTDKKTREREQLSTVVSQTPTRWNGELQETNNRMR